MPAGTPQEQHAQRLLRAARVGYAAHNASREGGLTWDDLSDERRETLIKATLRILRFLSTSTQPSLTHLTRVISVGLHGVSGAFVGAVAGYFHDHP